MIYYIINALIMQIFLLPANTKSALLYILYFIAWLIIALVATHLNSTQQYRHEDDMPLVSREDSEDDYYQIHIW